MKSRIYLMIAIQIVIVAIAYFIITRLTTDKVNLDITSDIFISLICATIFVIFVPKLTKVFLMVNRSKSYPLEDNEILINNFEIYTFGATIPEKTELKLTNQNIVITLYRQDKVYPISALKAMKISNFFGRPYSLNLNFGKKKLTIIAENALDIERKVRQIINQ